MEDEDPDLVPTQPAGSQAAETGNPPEQHKDAEPKPSEEENEQEKLPEPGPSTRKSGGKHSTEPPRKSARAKS